MKDNKKYVDFLKSKGLKTDEILYAVSLRNYGVTFTKAIYEFNELYNNKEIDGFPDSSIEVLEQFYGQKRMKRMKTETLFEKILMMQRTVTDNPDENFIIESIKYYLK